MANQFNNIDGEEIEMINLVLDDGTEMECEILAIFPANNNDYIALIPTTPSDDNDDEDEVLLYRYKELEDDEVELTSIEDEEEFEIVADAFDELLDEMEFNSMPDND